MSSVLAEAQTHSAETEELLTGASLLLKELLVHFCSLNQPRRSS